LLIILINIIAGNTFDVNRLSLEESSCCSTDDDDDKDEGDSDYDLDEEDDAFLSQRRKQDPNFKVTDNLVGFNLFKRLKMNT
jgi:hypothetical protein